MLGGKKVKVIKTDQIVETVAKLCIDANYYLGEDMMNAFKVALDTEESPAGKAIMKQLIDNAEIAKNEQVPMCQDCGAAVIFIEVGQDLKIDGNLEEAINAGVKKGYQEGYLRKSMCDPFTRKNTGDNTPAIIHTKLVPGENLKIIVAPKGGGSENMSAIKMFPPSAGVQGVKDFIIERATQAGPNPCPPIIIGVGIGGNFEKAALLAKESLLREVDEHSPIPEIAELEKEMLEKVNKIGVGPQGLGGTNTALALHINYMPCHIASFPVAININCHAARHKSATL